jgi:uncharacterized membrane protein
MPDHMKTLGIAYYLKVYGFAVLGFFVIDMIWLAFVARGFYKQHLQEWLREPPNWYAAIIFYLLFVAGMLVFAILPGLQAESLRKALLLGAFFGLVTYATYDLTNLATVKNWPLIVVVVDMIWGSVLATSVTAVGYFAGRWLAS